ncbi:MAG: Serine acetyltransferase [Promethearchaeota archaeon]|jgi:serine O-acetyltransferase|nr:MAG: Serine acetyltransferase [Candidatus Lokiarchaeota archaeon]
MKEKIKCMACGEESESGLLSGECMECILGLDFKADDIDKKKLNKNLQKILNFFVSDVNAALGKDPAAKSLVEVLTSYPGIKAVLLYRIGHFFWNLGMPFIPRYLSDVAREITGIEIHPGAKIGSDFFIDHGSGVVIGETSEIGDNVTIYAGVVLGGTSNEPVKRHPTIGNNVVIGTGAKLLGPIQIGNNVKVGANSVVINDIPNNSVVVGVPGRVISREGERIKKVDLEHADLPDPLNITLATLDKRLADLEEKLSKLNEK